MKTTQIATLITTLFFLGASAAQANQFSVTAKGGATGTTTETGSLRMRKVTVSVNPTTADVGQTGSVWVAAFVPPNSCAGVNGALFMKSSSGAWTLYDDKAVPAVTSNVKLTNGMSIPVLDMTATGVLSGPYLLRECKNAVLYVGVGRTFQTMLDSENYFIASTATWSSGTKTVGSDDWEVENERLVRIAQKNGVTYPSLIPGQTVTKVEGKVGAYYVAFGLDVDGNIGIWFDQAMTLAGTKFNCVEGSTPTALLNCTAMPDWADTNGAGHRP